MRYYIIEQSLDNLKVVWASQANSRVQRKVAECIFPSGSNWEKFAGYRAFRFVELDRPEYLFSYTVVIDDPSLKHYGLLRSWGVVSDARSFADDFRSMASFANYFRAQETRFQEDPFFYIMMEKLEAGDIGIRRWKRGCLWPLKWIGLQLGMKVVFKFDPQDAWYVERTILHTFKSTLWKNYFWSDKLSSFSTFTLSLSDPAEIIAIPE
jgi:hypothetical protein